MDFQIHHSIVPLNTPQSVQSSYALCRLKTRWMLSAKGMPSINSAQRFILIIGTIGVLTLLVFPPWQEITVTGQFTMFRSVGHAYFFDPPEPLQLNQSIEVAWNKLSLYLSLCIVSTGIVCLIFSNLSLAQKFEKKVVQIKSELRQSLDWFGKQDLLVLTNTAIDKAITLLVKIILAIVPIFGPLLLMALIPVGVERFTPYQVLPWAKTLLLFLGIVCGLVYVYRPQRNESKNIDNWPR